MFINLDESLCNQRRAIMSSIRSQLTSMINILDTHLKQVYIKRMKRLFPHKEFNILGIETLEDTDSKVSTPTINLVEEQGCMMLT